MLIYGIKKLKLDCSRQPEYRDPATLFGGLFISAERLQKFWCEERVLLMKKAHIPLTKCFALSDFGWGSLCSALPGP